MAVNTIDPTKPILGYALKQRIGTGGFGEVWAAEAPGGLPKAVKFIFGYHDEKRAQAELKALNRIRMVRHPFLLSLERIDIVESQLVVITELADMCLKTRFGQCVQSGLNGIPRAELLGYLRDSASALDYISEEFRLQHLDIKPENLLLLSGHIKVADFGLVKDIHDGTQSMMSGLTPAYAPPELFDGRPSKTSDQYSLAVLFQEMLTGIRPFDGTTAAQLATQHIHDRPVLKPLPREDQAIISRALSKDPELRYPNCTAMVEALGADRTRHESAPTPRTRAKLREGRGKNRRRTSLSSTLVEGTRPFAISPTEIVKLDNLEYTATEAKLRPTLFVGIGKTGTRVVRQVRRRLTERDGHRDNFPSIKFFCVDTDSADLVSSCHTGTTDELLSSEIFPLPLRRPEEYRNDAKMHLAWLSRRWIYNVPKSLRTEGIRPLGRLAFATHIEELSIRLRQVLSELVEAEALAKTAANLDLDPVAQPRVVLVGSISGGTCSGMAIDFAYTIRAILRQLGVLDEDVIGMFTHSTSDGGKQRELAIANSLAFLNELYHFSCVEEYPGDEACSIPPSTDGTTTFASTYLLHLGDDLSQLTYEDEIDSLAEYLYLSSATAGGTFFDTCRRQETESSGLPLRTMGLCRSGGSCSDVITECAYLLGEQVIRNWTELESNETFDASAFAARYLNMVTARTEQIVSLVHETMGHILKDPILHVARPLVEQFNELDREQTYDFIVNQVTETFGSFEGLTEETREAKLATAMNSLYVHFAADRMPKLVQGILDIVDAPGPRISGAFAVQQEITNQLRDQSAQLGCLIERSTENIRQMLRQVLSPNGPTNETAAEFFQTFAEALLQRFTLQSVQRVTDSIRPFAKETLASLEQIKIQFELATSDRIAEVRKDVRATFDLNGPGDKFLKRVLARLQERVPKLAGRVEQQLQHNFLDQHGGLRAVLADANQRDALHAQFDDATRASIVEQLKEISLGEAFDEELRIDAFADWMTETSTPRLGECGGALRMVHAYPQRSEPASAFVDELMKRNGQPPNLIPATVGELVVCAEVERVPLDNVAMQLFHGRPDSMEFASRLHTRTDIAWTHISSMR